MPSLAKAGGGHLDDSEISHALDPLRAKGVTYRRGGSCTRSALDLLPNLCDDTQRAILDLALADVIALTPQEVATTLMFQHQGYAVELADGMVLAAFAHPAHAVAWSLRLVQAMPLQVGLRCGMVPAAGASHAVAGGGLGCGMVPAAGASHAIAGGGLGCGLGAVAGIAAGVARGTVFRADVTGYEWRWGGHFDTMY